MGVQPGALPDCGQGPPLRRSCLPSEAVGCRLQAPARPGPCPASLRCGRWQLRPRLRASPETVTRTLLMLKSSSLQEPCSRRAGPSAGPGISCPQPPGTGSARTDGACGWVQSQGQIKRPTPALQSPTAVLNVTSVCAESQPRWERRSRCPLPAPGVQPPGRAEPRPAPRSPLTPDLVLAPAAGCHGQGSSDGTVGDVGPGRGPRKGHRRGQSSPSCPGAWELPHPHPSTRMFLQTWEVQ